MKSEKIRIGIVGLGHRGRHVFRLASEHGFSDMKNDFVEPVAACDIRSENWNEIRWGLQKPMKEIFPDTVFYNDYDKMLDEAGLDAVIVETGADNHALFCKKALDKNIHVLSDIPPVASLVEADFLWNAHLKSKAVFATGANVNEQKFVCTLRDIVDHGFIGKPFCMDAEYIHSVFPGTDENKYMWESGAEWRKLLSPIRYCTHSLGPLLSILDEDLTKVSCFGTGHHAAAEEYQTGMCKKDDMQCAQFQTASGVVIRVMRNGRTRAKIGHHSFRIFGTEGYIEIIGERGSLGTTMRWNSTKFRPAEELIVQPFPNGHGGADYNLVTNFLQTLHTGEAKHITLKDGLRMTLPGIYAEESANRGGEVMKISYPWYSDWKVCFD